MKFKFILTIDTEVYEKEFGIKITDPKTFMNTIAAGLIPSGTKSVTLTVETDA